MADPKILNKQTNQYDDFLENIETGTLLSPEFHYARYCQR